MHGGPWHLPAEGLVWYASMAGLLNCPGRIGFILLARLRMARGGTRGTLVPRRSFRAHVPTEAAQFRRMTPANATSVSREGDGCGDQTTSIKRGLIMPRHFIGYVLAFLIAVLAPDPTVYARG